MLDYIQSTALKKYYDENDIEISDFQKATLIYNSGYPLLDVINSLQELCNITDDDNLKKLIKNRLEYENNNIDLLKRSDNGYIYELKIYQEYDDEYEQTAIFSRYELAETVGMKCKQRFGIHKLKLYDDVNTMKRFDNYEDIENEIAYAIYNDKGNMEYCWTLDYSANTSINDIDYKKNSFEDKGMYFRHPFRSGDMVTFKYNNKYINGVVINQDREDMQFSAEYLSDSSILIVDKLLVGKNYEGYNHYHILPMFIEYQKK